MSPLDVQTTSVNCSTELDTVAHSDDPSQSMSNDDSQEVEPQPSTSTTLIDDDTQWEEVEQVSSSVPDHNGTVTCKDLIPVLAGINLRHTLRSNSKAMRDTINENWKRYKNSTGLTDKKYKAGTCTMYVQNSTYVRPETEDEYKDRMKEIKKQAEERKAGIQTQVASDKTDGEEYPEDDGSLLVPAGLPGHRMRNVPIPCGRESCFLYSAKCENDGLCLLELCKQHACETCRTKGTLVDYSIE